MADEIRPVGNAYRVEPARKKFSQEEKKGSEEDFRDLLGHSGKEDDAIVLGGEEEEKPPPQRQEMLNALTFQGRAIEIEEVDVDAEIEKRKQALKSGGQGAEASEKKEDPR